MDFDDFLMCQQVALYSLFDHVGATLVLIFTRWLELVPSWVQVGSKLGQVGTKIGPNGVHKQIILILPTNFALQRPRRRSAAPITRGSGLSLFEVSNLEFSGPKGHDLLGLAATRAAARFIPFGGAGRGPGTGPRFEYKVYQKSKKFNLLGNFTKTVTGSENESKV